MVKSAPVPSVVKVKSGASGETGFTTYTGYITYTNFRGNTHVTTLTIADVEDDRSNPYRLSKKGDF